MLLIGWSFPRENSRKTSKRLFTTIFLYTMADYASIFGETLLSKEGPVDVATLNGKYVGVYFS